MSVIRPYLPSDRADVYEVCLRTAAAGGDATGLYSHDDLMPEIFAGPYLEFDPTLAFVVDSGQRVSGYVAAVADTRSFVRWYTHHWMPRLARFPHVQPPLTAEDVVVDLGYRPQRMLPVRARSMNGSG